MTRGPWDHDGPRKAIMMLAEHSITAINQEAMVENLLNEIYGEKKFPRAVRVVLDMMIKSEGVNHERPTPKRLIARVKEASERSESSARSDIRRAVDLRVISLDHDAEKTNGGRKEYFFNPNQHDQACAYVEGVRLIRKVVEAQEASPLDPNAGRGLIDDKIYYNVINYDPKKDE